jgi:hypothetical protein
VLLSAGQRGETKGQKRMLEDPTSELQTGPIWTLDMIQKVP